MSQREAKMTDERAQCILHNQIEIMGALTLLLRYAQPDLVGKAGELDRQRDDLFQRHKATQRTLSSLTNEARASASALPDDRSVSTRTLGCGEP